MHRYANFFQSVCNCGSEIKSGDPVWLGASRTMWAHSSITVQLPTTTVASTEESKYNISTSANTTLTSQSVQWGADASLECELLPNPPCFNEVYLSRPFHTISCTGTECLTLSTRTSVKEQQRRQRRRSCSWSHGAQTAQRLRRRCSTHPPLTPWKSAW